MNYILKIIILILITTASYAQDYYIYNLYNNNFQAVFPKTPKLMVNMATIKMYMFADRNKGLVFMSKRTSYPTIKIEMTKLSKKELDKDLVFIPIKIAGHKLLSFKSKLDVRNKIYSYELMKKIRHEKGIVYQSSKGILYKNQLYSWSLQYLDLNKKSIFNNYKNYCKVK